MLILIIIRTKITDKVKSLGLIINNNHTPIMPDSVTTIGSCPRSLNRVPASAGVRTGMSHLSGGR